MSGSAQARRRITAEQRRAQIVDVARAVFVTQGVNATIKDIAADAGIDAALVFQHFGSKTALFEAAVLDPLADLVEDMRQGGLRLGAATDQAERNETLREMHADIARIITEIVPLLTVLFADPTVGRTFYREHLAPAIRDIARTGEKAIKGWSELPISPEDLTLAAFGVHLAFALHVNLAEEADEKQFADRISTLFWLLMTGTPVEAPTD